MIKHKETNMTKEEVIKSVKSVDVYKDENGNLYIRDINGEIIEDEITLNMAKRFLKENENE